MDELLIRVLVRLLRVHDELGQQAFENAARRALVGIGVAVQVEAERNAGKVPEGGKIIPIRVPPARPDGRGHVDPLDR